MIKRNDGFTLVEMIVSIIAGTIATAAVATILLLGMRMNAKTAEIATRDNQIMIGLSVMGDIAKENNIEVVSVDATADLAKLDNTVGWSVKNKDDDTIYYSYESEAICVNGVPLIENVDAASISGPDATGLLKIVLTVNDDQYPLSVRCRLLPEPTDPTDTTE